MAGHGSPEIAISVRLVITLGTPFTGHPKATNAWRLYELVAGHKIGAPEIHEPLRVPPPVPTTRWFVRPVHSNFPCSRRPPWRTEPKRLSASA